MFGSFRKHDPEPPNVFSEGRAGSQLPFVDENLVDIGGELNVQTLLRAYRSGSFPWTVDPVTWWSPDPRAVIEYGSLHVSRSLARAIQKGRFSVTVDQQFDDVIDACGAWAPQRRTTWITAEFVRAYKEMHRAGHGHSLEVWQGGKLIGGIYGVAIGGYFAGESMFHRVSNASKAAVYFLVQHLRGRGYTLFDIQMPTRVTLQLGASLLPRREFLVRLRDAQRLPATFGSEFAGKS
ncbi:MAG TPA: leucyl/phenylalanyl-tRNA--protein transferase [Verrucomicrobiae bacterium]|jgi:leucyl/phenylalanyl-tRNA--protein transferase|nr:leucyl/phenylalanyl-tRNA--protein transferase [Verrucomicrobiae bacterium]